MADIRTVRLLLVTSLLVFSIASVLGETTPREIAQLCLRSCDCELFHKQNKAHLQVRCDNVKQFPAIFPRNTTVVILNNSPLVNLTADDLQNKNLENLKDFQCSNCLLKNIDRAAFKGLSDLKTIDLSDNLLVELTADTFTDQKNLVVLNLDGNEDLDCEAFLKKFGEWRPKVKVECEGTTTEVFASDEDYQEISDETTLSSNVRRMNDPGAAEATDRILQDGSPTDDVAKPSVDDRALPIATQPPEEDPSTFFPIWKIVVIVIVGVLILVVAGYYVWNKWTEIRSCCCGPYQQP